MPLIQVSIIDGRTDQQKEMLINEKRISFFVPSYEPKSLSLEM